MYVVRADFSAQMRQTGSALGYIGYLGRELCMALDPFLLAYGFLSKRWWLIILGFGGQLVYFGQTGMKEVPLAVFLMYGIWLLYRRFGGRYGIALLLVVSGMIALCACVDMAKHDAILSAQFTRRTLATPGLLTGFYFEHFSAQGHHGHITDVSGTNDAYAPPQEIGLYYYGTTDADENANFWAEGFAELGVPGMFLFAFLVAFALWLYDSIAARRSLELALLLVVMQADALTNTSPLTVLATHGGLLIAILLYFAPDIGQPLRLKTQPSWPRRRRAIGRIFPQLTS